MRVGAFPAIRPHHYVLPVLARRKSDRYEEQIRKSSAAFVQPTDHNLTSRLAALLAGDYPASRRFHDLVAGVLGLRIGLLPSDNGQEPGVALTMTEGISLDRMGEGVGGALALLTELADAEGKLFLIEEPENDLHPQALSALLDALLDAVPANQLVVSTHSDLVLRQLGAVPGAVVYRTELAAGEPVPTTTFAPVRSREDRLRLLADLGYEPELPAGWLVLEESTAERVIKQVLIPMFAPALAGFRTVSAGGTARVAKMFDELNRVVLFARLSDRYDQRAWVLVDGDPSGLEVTQRLKDSFPAWPASRFRALDRPAFEHYYPERFEPDAAAALAASDWAVARELKGALAEKVCAWAEAAPDEARAELARSAAEVIEFLHAVAHEAITR
jgi:hypothetical protein